MFCIISARNLYLYLEYAFSGDNMEIKKFALLGNPNSGKTTLFTTLTGATARVGNWPGVTVEKREGYYKNKKNAVSIVDLPGVYSLSPYTPEEEITENYLLTEKPDCVINVVDSTNLERNLYLTTQLIETDIPIVVALNMYDVAKKRGDKIDIRALRLSFGVPFVFVSALKGEGIESLIETAVDESNRKRKGKTFIENKRVMDYVAKLQSEEPKNSPNVLYNAIKTVYSKEQPDYSPIIADERYKFIEKTLSTSKLAKTLEHGTKTEKADRILTNKFFAYPIFALVLFLTFHLTFSNDLFWLGGLIKGKLYLEGTPVQGLFGDWGIASPGVIMKNGVDILSALAKKSLFVLMSEKGISDWAIGLVTDGILGGIFSVLSFLPQILLLFLFFSTLEDSGYMSRIAFILDKPLRRFNLTGRAFLPMIMGFGCSVPAMINTRTLSDEKEKLATVRVIPFFFCGAKLPVLTAIVGVLGGTFGVNHADLICYALYLVGVVVAFVSVFVMRKTTLKSELPPFIMELPDYRKPSVKNTAKLLFDKAKHFFKKAFTVILASTIIIWCLSHFSFDFVYLDNSQMDSSILSKIGMIITPIFTPLGFGGNLRAYGWIFAISVLTGLVAKENVIATLGSLSSCIVLSAENNPLETLVLASGITLPALISFVCFNMLTIPCVATVVTAKSEIQNKKYFFGTIIFWLATSYTVSAIISAVGIFPYSIFVFLGILLLGVVALCLCGEIKIRKFFVKPKAKK